jgi:hypothetical protein
VQRGAARAPRRATFLTGIINFQGNLLHALLSADEPGR